MKYYNISVNGVAYSVSVEETAAGAAPVAPAAAPAPKAAPAPAAAAAPAAPAAPASDRKSTRLNSSHTDSSRMPSSA